MNDFDTISRNSARRETSESADALSISLMHSQRRVRQLSSQLDAANRSMSQFLANMGHEIRTPMNGIVGVCELLSETKLSDQQSQYLQTIRTSAQTLLRLLNDVLDFAKIEAGKLAFEKIPFSLSHLLHEVVDLFIEEVSRKDIELVMDLPPEVPDRLQGDPLRLRQVVLNLLSNAIKFTDHGEIALAVRRIPNRSQKSVRLEFSIRDTGIGIPAESQDRLFDAFTQADGSTTRKYGGTGLGLAICRRIVELMGGKIRLQSQPGKGSTFSFTTRLGLACKEDFLSPLLPDAMRGLRVVVAEGQPSARRILMRQLDSLGLRAERVDTLSALMQSCIPTAQRPGVDLLFLSSQFDGGNPLKEAVSLLHALHATPPLIVLLSRAGRESERQQGPGKGHDAILLKPIRLAVLRDTIVSLCHDPHARRLANLDRRDLAPPLAGAFPLQRLPGLDVARGLQRAGGSWRLYLEGLSACCRAYRSLTAQIQELLAQNDFASACQRAQELKDDAAHIAAHRLCAAARALQVSCARHDDSRIAARLRFVQTSLQQLERSAAQLGCEGSALPVAPSGAAIAPAPALMEALIALDHSLQELDPVRSDQCLQTVKTWGDHMGFEFGINELERQIQHYDFAGARQTLQRLLTLSS